MTKTGEATVTLTGVNALSGQTQVLGGTLAVSGAGLLSAGTLLLDGAGASVDLGGSEQTVSVLSLRMGSVVNGKLNALGGFQVEAGTISGMLTGAGSLVKTGSGTVVLSGANDYAGGTDVTQGVLRMGAQDLLASTLGGVNVLGGSLDLGGFGTQSSQFLLAGGTVANGTLNASGYELRSGLMDAVLIGAGSLTKSTGGEVVSPKIDPFL